MFGKKDNVYIIILLNSFRPMLTDFPEIKKEIMKLYNIALRTQVKQSSPILNMVNKKFLFEGDRMGTLASDGSHEISHLKLVESKMVITKEEAPNINQEEVINKLSTMAQDMAGQMERDLLQAMTDAASKNGNTVTGNPELSPEAILIAMEMTHIDFENDDRNKPIKPAIIASPEAVEKLKQTHASSTPEELERFEKRQNEILDKKFQEHVDDLNSRKIVD